MKTIMILGGPEFQIPVVEQAKRMGLYTVVLDISSNAVCSTYADEFYVCSVKDYDKVLEIAKAVKPDAITVGMVDSAVLVAAKVCKVLGLHGLDPDVARIATDKYLMIEAFDKYGVPHPQFQFVDKSQIDTFDFNLDLPVIVKPVDSAGSKGIRLIHNASEVKEAIHDSYKESESGSILLEEYMVGPEVSVETIVIDSEPTVLQVTDKITSGAPYFMEIGHNQPSVLPDETIARIKDVACRAARAVGLVNSIVHAEIIITSEGPKMVELGARMGGDGIQEQLAALSSGINIPEISIKLALGDKVEIPKPKIEKHSAIRFIQAKEGVVESVENIDISQQLDHVKYLKVYCKPGDTYKTAQDNSGRLGYAITQANTREDAVSSCKRAINTLKITFLPVYRIELVEAIPDWYDTYYKYRCDQADIYWTGYLSAPDYEKMRELYFSRCDNVDLNKIGSEKIYFIRKYSHQNYLDVGYVLLYNKKDGFEFAYSVLEKYRGQGIGTYALGIAKEIAMKFTTCVYGLVRDDNIASQKVFLKNGFIKTDIIEERPSPALGTIKLRKWIYTK